jgi:hypothetical protein
MTDNRDRSRFRLATSRREELTMQQELDDVGKKSIAEIVVAKEARKAIEDEHPQEALRYVTFYIQKEFFFSQSK